MFVYVLYRYWDTPDNEGNEVMGVYRKREDAISDMKADVVATRAYYDPDFWDDDMTWEDECEIHLGNNSNGCGLDTIYCWGIEKKEVQ